MGGAYSIDRESRVHRSELFGWFEEETISQKDIINLPDEHIDIVISHTCPNEFVISDYHISYGHDPSRDALSYILDKYRPRFWYFGHMHTFKQGINKGCKWTCLSGIGINSHRWWIELEK
jgi:Icc-related predicted phosphoesterase